MGWLKEEREAELPVSLGWHCFGSSPDVFSDNVPLAWRLQEGCGCCCPHSNICMTPRENQGLALSSRPPVYEQLYDGCKKEAFITKV